MKRILSSIFRIVICSLEIIALGSCAPVSGSNSLNFVRPTGLPQPPACLDDLTIQIASNPSKIKSGETSVVSWSVDLPPHCGSMTVNLNGRRVNPSGSQTVKPSQSTTYSVTVFFNIRGVSGETTRSTRVTVSCSENPTIVEIREANPEIDKDQHQAMLIRLIESVSQPDTTILLGPDVVLDFSDFRTKTRKDLGLPDNIDLGLSDSNLILPLVFARCVTLTSVSSFVPDNSGGTQGSGRTQSSLGPLLKYGLHHDDDEIFLFIRCSSNQSPSDNVRISGFRLIGPNPGQQSDLDYGIEIVGCVNIEISNMEIADWGGAGVLITDDEGLPGRIIDGGRITDPDQVKIHNNFFHHNQHPSTSGHARGYGVDVHDGAWARISENVFDFNRHAISAHKDAGGYIAERNLVLKGGGYHGAWYSTYTHSFDAHGSGCWWDDDLCGDAGIRFSFVANAFQYHNGKAINIRGKPAVNAYIADNVFAHADLENFWGDGAVKLNDSENVEFGPGNVTNFDSYGRYGVCDFDGDGIDDLFLATGKTWWYSSYGEFQWTYLSDRTEGLDQVGLGYFDDDLLCDVLTESDADWVISSGGTGEWLRIGQFGAKLSEVTFGRFDPNVQDHRPGVTRRTTHAFWRTESGQWKVTPLSKPDWQDVESSSFPMNKLQFGDFTGDGITDVLAVEDGHWAISESANSAWQTLNPNLSDDVSSLYIADLNNNNIDDLIKLEHTFSNGVETFTWWVSDDGRSPWRSLKTYTFQQLASDTDVPVFTFAGRFGAAPGGGVLLIDRFRIGHFFSPAEISAGVSPDWTSLFPY